jgi:hypothetical protein
MAKRNYLSVLWKCKIPKSDLSSSDLLGHHKELVEIIESFDTDVISADELQELGHRKAVYSYLCGGVYISTASSGYEGIEVPVDQHTSIVYLEGNEEPGLIDAIQRFYDKFQNVERTDGPTLEF